jgi:hypothetical protein
MFIVGRELCLLRIEVLHFHLLLRDTEKLMRLLQPFRNANFLRAHGLTLTAFETAVSPLFRLQARDALIKKAWRPKIFVHQGLVIKFKDTWDVNAIRAGLAILTVGAWDWG